MIGAILWRQRGRLGEPWTIVFSGYIALLMSPVIGWWAVLYALWIFLGEKPGWGSLLYQLHEVDKPRERDGWQTDWLVEHPWISAIFRGAMIGGIGAVAFPLAQLLTRGRDHWWEKQEYVFGFLFEAMILCSFYGF